MACPVQELQVPLLGAVHDVADAGVGEVDHVRVAWMPTEDAAQEALDRQAVAEERDICVIVRVLVDDCVLRPCRHALFDFALRLAARRFEIVVVQVDDLLELRGVDGPAVTADPIALRKLLHHIALDNALDREPDVAADDAGSLPSA